MLRPYNEKERTGLKTRHYNGRTRTSEQLQQKSLAVRPVLRVNGRR